MNKDTKFLRKEFISSNDDASTSTIVSFYGKYTDIHGGLEEGGFLEISDCKRKVRFNTSENEPLKEYIEGIRKMEKICKEFGDFLESIAPV